MLNQHRSTFHTPKLGTRLFYLRIFISHLVFSPYTFTLLSLPPLRKMFHISKRFYLHIVFTYLRATSFCLFLVSRFSSRARTQSTR